MKRFLLPPLLLCVCLCPLAHTATWLPISDEERSYTQSNIDPAAGAEVLYKSILLDDDEPTNSYREYYLRVKIYDERGAKSLGSYRMAYNSASSKMGTPAARIVRKDGSVIEVQKSEIYSQNLKNDSGGSIRSRGFSFPELKEGDIVDIKYRINLHEYYYSPELFVTFQEPWPLRKASVKVRPASWVEGSTFVKWMTSKCDSRGMKRKPNGFYELDVENFPADVDEPHRPPEKQNIAWLLFYMAPNGKTGDDYWKSEGVKLYRSMAGISKAGSAVKKAVKEAVQGVSGEEETLRAIYRYCVTGIVNSIHGEAGRLSPDDRKEIKGDMSAEKILAQGFGSPRNVNTVFCAMAQAAGFDARLAAVNSRTGYQFSKVLSSIDTTLRRRCIAVKLGEEWRYFDPGGRYLPFGELDWDEQGVAVVVSDKKKLELHAVPFSAPENSVAKSDANLELSEKGTLWGEVEFEYSGHFEVELKRALDGRSEQERREYMKNRFNDRWPRASVSAIKIENAASPTERLKISANIRIDSYAEAIGDRLFVSVNVFEEASEPEFPETQRVSDMFFPFAMREIQSAVIKLPDGFELEAPSAPRPLTNKGVFEYSPKLGVKQKSNTLVYSNDFVFSGKFFPAKFYATVKRLFDDKHTQDQHSITLKKKSVEVSSL